MSPDALTDVVGGKLKLGKTNVSITQDTILADLTVCDFTGYADLTLTAIGTPFLDPTNGTVTLTAAHTFAVGATPTIFNDVFNWWIVDSAGVLLCAGQFTNQIPMQRLGDALPIQIGIVLFGADNRFVVDVVGWPQ